MTPRGSRPSSRVTGKGPDDLAVVEKGRARVIDSGSPAERRYYEEQERKSGRPRSGAVALPRVSGGAFAGRWVVTVIRRTPPKRGS